MKMMLIKIMLMNSSIVWVFKNPMSMGIMLLLQTMMMILLINLIAKTSWFTMITFLMMIGGLLILFTYMSSIASNEKMKMKLNLTVIMVLLLIMIDELVLENQINESMSILNMNNTDFSLMKIYNKKSLMMSILMVTYLLLTMISVSKIVKHHEGPLRSYKKYE